MRCTPYYSRCPFVAHTFCILLYGQQHPHQRAQAELIACAAPTATDNKPKAVAKAGGDSGPDDTTLTMLVVIFAILFALLIAFVVFMVKRDKSGNALFTPLRNAEVHQGDSVKQVVEIA